MRKRLGVLIIVIVIALAAVVWQKQKTNEQTNNVQPAAKAISYQMQTDEEGGVSVGVTPINLSQENMSFRVVLNTHLVDLDYDLKELSVLITDENEYKALSWSGGKGGHHLEGTLVFPPLSKDAKAVKLVIRGIEGVDRNFEWEM